MNLIDQNQKKNNIHLQALLIEVARVVVMQVSAFYY